MRIKKYLSVMSILAGLLATHTYGQAQAVDPKREEAARKITDTIEKHRERIKRDIAELEAFGLQHADHPWIPRAIAQTIAMKMIGEQTMNAASDAISDALQSGASLPDADMVSMQDFEGCLSDRARWKRSPLIMES